MNVFYNWQDLFQGVKTLQFFYSSTYDHDMIIECLKKCKLLQFLSISFEDDYHDKFYSIGDFFEKSNRELIQLPIERLKIICFPYDARKGLVHFIKGRLNDPLATKIKSIRIHHGLNLPKDASIWRWLVRHVADCEIEKEDDGEEDEEEEDEEDEELE